MHVSLMCSVHASGYSGIHFEGRKQWLNQFAASQHLLCEAGFGEEALESPQCVGGLQQVGMLPVPCCLGCNGAAGIVPLEDYLPCLSCLNNGPAQAQVCFWTTQSVYTELRSHGQRDQCTVASMGPVAFFADGSAGVRPSQIDSSADSGALQIILGLKLCSMLCKNAACIQADRTAKEKSGLALSSRADYLKPRQLADREHKSLGLSCTMMSFRRSRGSESNPSPREPCTAA